MFSLMSEEEPISISRVVELRADDTTKGRTNNGTREGRFTNATHEEVHILRCAVKILKGSNTFGPEDMRKIFPGADVNAGAEFYVIGVCWNAVVSSSLSVDGRKIHAKGLI